MSDGGRKTRDDAEIAARLFPHAWRFGKSIEGLEQTCAAIEGAMRYARPLFPAYLLGGLEEGETTAELHARSEADRLRFEASGSWSTVRHWSEKRQEWREMFTDEQPATLAAAEHFSHDPHPFTIPCHVVESNAPAAETVLKAAASLVLKLRATALLSLYTETPEDGRDAAKTATGATDVAIDDREEAEPRHLTGAEEIVLVALRERAPRLSTEAEVRKAFPRDSRYDRRPRGEKKVREALQALEAAGYVDRPEGPGCGRRITRAGLKMAELVQPLDPAPANDRSCAGE